MNARILLLTRPPTIQPHKDFEYSRLLLLGWVGKYYAPILPQSAFLLAFSTLSDQSSPHVRTT